MLCFCIFFLMLRLSPISTLFPYTTLFRSDSSHLSRCSPDMERFSLQRWKKHIRKRGLLFAKSSIINARSEEHTSELQSPCNLVCRLLLEKKKKQNININRYQITTNL